MFFVFTTYLEKCKVVWMTICYITAMYDLLWCWDLLSFVLVMLNSLPKDKVHIEIRGRIYSPFALVWENRVAQYQRWRDKAEVLLLREFFLLIIQFSVVLLNAHIHFIFGIYYCQSWESEQKFQYQTRAGKVRILNKYKLFLYSVMKIFC